MLHRPLFRIFRWHVISSISSRVLRVQKTMVYDHVNTMDINPSHNRTFSRMRRDTKNRRCVGGRACVGFLEREHLCFDANATGLNISSSQALNFPQGRRTGETVVNQERFSEQIALLHSNSFCALKTQHKPAKICSIWNLHSPENNQSWSDLLSTENMDLLSRSRGGNVSIGTPVGHTITGLQTGLSGGSVLLQLVITPCLITVESVFVSVFCACRFTLSTVQPHRWTKMA